MKNLKYLLAFLLFGSSFQLFSQLSIGVKTGYVKAWLEYGDIEVPDDAKIHVDRFQISGLSYLELNKHISLGAEPGFVQRGAACVPGYVNFIGDTKLFSNYIELPIMASVSIPVFGNKFEVFGKAGYGASYMISAYRQIEPTTQFDEPEKTKLDLKNDDLQRWDHGLYSGLGMAYLFDRNQLFLESTYYMGMTDIDPLNKSKNRSINIGAGYRVILK